MRPPLIFEVTESGWVTCEVSSADAGIGGALQSPEMASMPKYNGSQNSPLNNLNEPESSEDESACASSLSSAQCARVELQCQARRAGMS